MGSSRGATPAPKRSFSSSSVRVNDARSRSSLLTKMVRGMSRASARRHTRLGLDLDALDGRDDEHGQVGDAERRGDVVDEVGVPGVSSRLTLWPSHSKGARVSDTEMVRFCSSGSKSVTVLPSSTRPIRLVSPATKSSASVKVVFPAWPCPTSATLRIIGDGTVFTLAPPCG